MKQLIGGFLVTMLVLAVIAPVGIAASKQVCPVCRVKEGSDELESVKATRTYEGVAYGFCSDDCAREFDTDPAAYVPPALPRPAPALRVTDLAGKPVTWNGLAGKVVLLDFWATWCAPCRKSMPELAALHRKYQGRGFQVLGVSIDEGGPKKAAQKVKKFVTGKKLDYPMAIDSDSDPTWQAYRVKAVPAAFLVDGKGRIVAQWTGAVSAAEVEAKLESLLSTTTGALVR